jgi:hypothetical protein
VLKWAYSLSLFVVLYRSIFLVMWPLFSNSSTEGAQKYGYENISELENEFCYGVCSVFKRYLEEYNVSFNLSR